MFWKWFQYKFYVALSFQKKKEVLKNFQKLYMQKKNDSKIDLLWIY